MAEIPDPAAGEQNGFSDTDPRWRQLRGIVDQAECFPPDTEMPIRSMREVEPLTGQTYLIEAEDGTDILINWRSPMPDVEDGWHDITYLNSAAGHLLNPHDTLRGLFSQRRRQLVQPGGGAWVVTMLTGPRKFNATMEDLGREPGVDCLKMEGRPEGYFTGASIAEAGAQLTILTDTSQEFQIWHDRELGDHVVAWWATPGRRAQVLQRAGVRARDSGNPQDAKSYAHGLDLLRGIPHSVLDVVCDAVDSPWQSDETAESRLRAVRDHIDGLCGPVGSLGGVNTAYRALIKLGFIPGMSAETAAIEYIKWPHNAAGAIDQESPIVVGAREVLREWLMDYAANIADMLERADGLVGPPDDVNLEQRRLLVEALKEAADELYTDMHEPEPAAVN